MTETTQEERDAARDYVADIEGDDWECGWLQRALNDADRLDDIERQVIYRTEDMPAGARLWIKKRAEAGDQSAQTAIVCWTSPMKPGRLIYRTDRGAIKDYRPDEPGPIFLPIIDALDASGED